MKKGVKKVRLTKVYQPGGNAWSNIADYPCMFLVCVLYNTMFQQS